MSVNVKLRNRMNEDVIYEGIETVTLDTDIENVQAVFTLGTAAQKTVDLDFSSSDTQIVTPNEGNLLTAVRLIKPDTLVPESILDGIEIAGVMGTFRPGPEILPTLNAVTITRNGGNLSISNPSTNGNFVTNYKIFNGDKPLTVSTSTTFPLINLGHGAFSVRVAAANPKFLDSNKTTAIDVKVFTVDKFFTNLTTTDTTALLSDGLFYEFHITPLNGFYLPDSITVKIDGEEVSNYEWNDYSGHFSYKSLDGDIEITAVAADSDRIHRPLVSIQNEKLYVTPSRFAEETIVYIDDVEEWHTTDTDTITVSAVSGSTYSFVLNANGYYESQNRGRSNSYSLCRVDFNFAESRDVVFHCINSAYLGNCYGLISQLDTTLALGYASDGATGSANVLRNFSDTNSYSDVDVKINIPAGEHFIYVKYRKQSSTTTGKDSLQFCISKL